VKLIVRVGKGYVGVIFFGIAVTVVSLDQLITNFFQQQRDKEAMDVGI